MKRSPVQAGCRSTAQRRPAAHARPARRADATLVGTRTRQRSARPESAHTAAETIRQNTRWFARRDKMVLRCMASDDPDESGESMPGDRRQIRHPYEWERFQLLEQVPVGVFVVTARGTPYYASTQARDAE